MDARQTDSGGRDGGSGLLCPSLPCGSRLLRHRAACWYYCLNVVWGTGSHVRIISQQSRPWHRIMA
jgi:hypothetical protein